MQRLIRNVLRFPTRTWKSLKQITDPAWQLQRTADREVPTWWPTSLYQQLLALEGFTSKPELHFLVYLASQCPVDGCWVEIGA
jgi:hypothetical protein